MNRRKFLQNTSISTAGIILYTNIPVSFDDKGLLMKPAQLLGKLTTQKGKTPIKNASWYEGKEIGDGILYKFDKGALANFKNITDDLLLDGNHTTNFIISLQ